MKVRRGQVTICPGCGLKLPDPRLDPNRRLSASPECWDLFCKLSAKTMSLHDTEFIHQTAIDSYQAQHAGGINKNISVAFGLIGLYLALERGYSGREVQKAHMVLANRFKDWPKFEPPTREWQMTVQDILQAKSDSEYREKIRLWAKSVWEKWQSDRDRIIELVEKYLYR